MENIHVFISLPMRDKSDEEIRQEIEIIKNQLIIYFRHENKRPVFCDSYLTRTKLLKPILAVSESIKTMSNADVVFFAKGWDEARGCMTEHTVATNYGLRVIHFDEPDFINKKLPRLTAAAFADKCHLSECTNCEYNEYGGGCEDWLYFNAWIESSVKDFIISILNYNTDMPFDKIKDTIDKAWVSPQHVMRMLLQDIHDFSYLKKED